MAAHKLWADNLRSGGKAAYDKLPEEKVPKYRNDQKK